MPLLMVNKEDLLYFHSASDASFWLKKNPGNEIIIMEEDEFDEEFQEFLDEHCPIEIIAY